jgi:hypothetical protein
MVTALPIVIVTYAALFLLGGLMIMTCAAGSETGISDHQMAFRVIVLVPVCIVLLCLVAAMLGCEAFLWMEAKYAQVGDVEESGDLPFSVEKTAQN